MFELAKILSYIIGCILGFTISKLDISVYHKWLLGILIILEIIIIAFIGYYTYIGG